VAWQLLLGHKKTASKFVEDNYDEFFAKFLDILKSKNYITKRQLLRLLARAF
jgi:calcium binding protein 39